MYRPQPKRRYVLQPPALLRVITPPACDRTPSMSCFIHGDARTASKLWLTSALRVEDECDNKTVESKNFSEDKNEDHADKDS